MGRFSSYSSMGDKIDAHIDAPVNGLDMRPYVKNASEMDSEDLVYDLHAISNHFGGSGGGHCKISFRC
jgi:ubiquitin carboxyl-terminal hydrolase 4/11/15